MADQGIDALVVAGRGLVSHWGYLEYLTGYCPIVRHGYAVVTPGREPIVVMSTRSDAYFSRQANGFDTRVAGEGDVVGEGNVVPASVAAVLTEQGHGSARIGVVGVGQIIPAGEWDALRGALPMARMSDATDLLQQIKTINTEAELADVRLAGRVADVGIEAFMAHAAAGVSGWDLYGEMARAVRSAGARELLIFIGTGPYFLDWPSAQPLQRGDLVSVYVEATGPTGCWVERAGLFTVGAVDGLRREYGETCLRAHAAAKDALTVGATAADVATALEAETAELGALPGIWHGHGVGIDHDTPVITRGDQTPLAEGMVISIHPNLTDPSETVGASVADTYILGPDGAETISQISQEIRPIERTI